MAIVLEIAAVGLPRLSRHQSDEAFAEPLRDAFGSRDASPERQPL
jgi:hypothetical protein